MNVLFFGDVVGPKAARYLADRLPDLKRRHGVDLAVANAENCAVTGPSPMNGFGMTVELVDLLLESGVDVVTGGNHSWDGPEAREALSNPRVLRPRNVFGEAPGKGTLTTEAAGRRVTVLNLLSETARLPDKLAPDPSPPYEAYEAWRWSSERPDDPGVVIVDFHGDSPWEKASFAAAVDGEVAAVLGTHTHDPTARCHVLPGGTVLVAEVGMTGRLGFTGGGFDPVHFAAVLRGEDLGTLPPYELAGGPMVLGAVLVHVENGNTVSAERVVYSPGDARSAASVRGKKTSAVSAACSVDKSDYDKPESSGTRSNSGMKNSTVSQVISPGRHTSARLRPPPGCDTFGPSQPGSNRVAPGVHTCDRRTPPGCYAKIRNR